LRVAHTIAVLWLGDTGTFGVHESVDSERAGEFGLAEEQADLGWFKEDRCSGTRGITPGVERSCAQAYGLYCATKGDGRL